MIATVIHVGHTARTTMFEVATNGAEQRAIVIPATVRMRPCKVWHRKQNLIKKMTFDPLFNKLFALADNW